MKEITIRRAGKFYRNVHCSGCRNTVRTVRKHISVGSWNNGSSQGADCSALNVDEIRSDGNVETWNGLVRAPSNYLLLLLASLWANVTRFWQC
jgi:hypothetical protein